MYADYPISRELMHWESQENTAQHHTDGQNLIHHQERGYTILVFARDQKKRKNATVPFTYLGQVDMGALGLRVIRFSNDDVLRNIEGVYEELSKIIAAIKSEGQT